MRVITGKAKGIALKTPLGNETRPTAERVKEAVFSMLQFDIEGRKVLDLFAGTGQMGIEALSRGAAEAVFVDKSKDAIKLINENLQKAKLSDKAHVFQADYLDYIKRNANKAFDIIILDPPYAKKMYAPALSAMLDALLIKPTTIIVCESGANEIFDGNINLKGRFNIEKQSKYSNTVITLLKLKENSENE